jgi:GNAT superfamily N-acetyltransferase
VTLGLLNDEDVDAALALSDAEGWNKTAADWTRITRLEPSGCFAARDGQRVIGTVTTTTYGRTMAWIGMMIVHPDFRRQGVGAALMRFALDYLHGLDIASVKLDATPAGRPLYESLGFAAEAEVERWQGVVRHPGGPSNSKELTAKPATRPLFELDRAAFGADRSRLLERLVSECPGGPLVVASDDGVLEGYALARQGQTAAYIGPMVVTTARAAAQLLDGMLARFDGETVCLDFHRSGRLEPGVLADRGLSKRRGLTRMRHGPPNDAGDARSIAASAGPEFG